ncbi:hypothetical protein J1605_020045 [Eschrichtius robustus]|uniref:Interferon alpha-inducible protein 27, mitochondrial n=1 Tax=Eschrichtius robustus TaxID=9764 RepID=A0AB34HL27_ESCRO|nr:hypothetical protein J1605_020045 [Eschrichtius robustus]
MKAISLAACIPSGCTSGGWNCYKHPASGLPRTQTSSRPTGLTMSSSAALAGATSTLGSLLGTLNGSYLLGCPAAALTAFPLGGNWPWVIDTPPWTPTQHMGPRLLQLWWEEVSPCRNNLLLAHPQALGLGEPLALHLLQASSLAVVAVPTVLGAVGFTGAGIAASSLAAKMMSAAAIANGGGVAAGSLVATFQSVAAPGCLSHSTHPLLLPQDQLDSPCHPESSWDLLGLPLCPSWWACDSSLSLPLQRRGPGSALLASLMQ